jgi:Tol biopolymer transport system component
LDSGIFFFDATSVIYGVSGLDGPDQYLNHAITDDGSRVFFTSLEQLVPEDTNGKADVYEYDTATGRLHLLSTGQCGCNSTFVDASTDGSNVFFTTSQQLVRFDQDNNRDLYDARVGGGIAAQNAPPLAQCQGDSCQSPATAPSDVTPATETHSGAGNTVGKAVGRAKVKKPQRKKRRHRSRRHAKHATRRHG